MGDLPVRGRHGEQAAQQADSLLLRRELPELPGDDVVLGPTEVHRLVLGDLNHQRALGRLQTPQLGHQLLHGPDLLLRHVEIRVCHAGEHVGEGGDETRLFGRQAVQLGGDAPDGLRVPSFVLCPLRLEAQQSSY